jgi:hypothetical protein
MQGDFMVEYAGNVLTREEGERLEAEEPSMFRLQIWERKKSWW